jgi:TonB-dependent SusC/RagA subfamily outer membrane receptor
MTTAIGQLIARRPRREAWFVIASCILLAAPGLRAQNAPNEPAPSDHDHPFAPRVAKGRALTGTVTGRVTDARTSAPIPDAAVQVDGTRIGATTGSDGRYRLAAVTAGSHVIIVRRLGYAAARQTVNVTDDQQTTSDFTMQPAAVALDQVVVTGTAGGEQRRSIGNAVSTINASEELSKSAAPNLSSLLATRAPGVVISTSTSRLGAGPSIQIRGRTSISLDNSPLLYVDGVRVDNSTGTGSSGVSGGGSSLGSQRSQVGGRLNDINPEDIESIEIIKGPAAATIYGTEAANGVIQIITKKGAVGRTDFSMQVQTGSLYFRDAAGRIPTNYVKDPATGAIVPWNGVQSEEDRGTPIFRTGQTRQYTGSISGGRDLLRYYVSSNYENDLGIEPNNTLRQFALHSNLNVSPNAKVDFGTSLNFVDQAAHLGADNGVSPMLGATVGHALLFKNGRGFYPNFTPEIPQQLYDNSNNISRFTGSGTLNHRPVDWFTHSVILGIDYTGDDSHALERFAPPTLAPLLGTVAAGGRVRQTLRHNSVITATYAGTAKLRLTSALSSSTSIGGQFYRTDFNASTLGGWGFPGPGIETVSGTANREDATQTKTLNTTVGAYVEEKVALRDRLFLTAGLRVDNNSAFGNDFKWVTYPKVGLAWVVNEEPFWKWSSAINTLKLRAAYGQSGRQPNAYAALRTFLPVPGPAGSNAVTPNSFGNPDLKPERGTELEVGFESELFNRLSLDVTYFSKQTKDEILNQPLAPSSGFTGNQFVNLGRVDNHGIEVQGTLRALTLRRIAWDIGGNVATNKDEIKDLGGLPSVIANAGQFNKVGYPIGGIFTRRVVKADRNPTTGGAINVLCDGGAGQAPVACATAPFVFIGTPTPKLSGAITNTVTIMSRLRLYAMVDFKRGHRVYNANEQIRCQGLVGAPLCRANYYPLEFSPIYLAETPGTASAIGNVDQFYQDGSFAKLREVSATFTLPDKWLWGGGSRASFSIAARELHTWTNYNGPDPEAGDINQATSAATHDQGVIPPLSRLIATLNVRF